MIVEVAREYWKKKKSMSHKFCAYRCLEVETSALGLEFNSNILVGNYFFHKNYGTVKGTVSHNVFYYQQLSVARYQVSFYANNYFE